MNDYGLELNGLLTAKDIITADGRKDLYYNRETGILRVYDVDPLDYPAELVEEDEWLYAGTYDHVDYLQDLADGVALHVFWANDKRYPMPILDGDMLKKGQRWQVSKITWQAYGDLYTYADGHEEYFPRD